MTYTFDELYPAALTILEETSANICYRLENAFNYTPLPPLSDEQWNEYGDALERLHVNLQHLEYVVNCEYKFSEEMQETANDVVNYTAELLKYREPLSELAGYLLSQLEVPEHQNFSGNRPYVLNDALHGIIDNCTIINRLIGRQP